MATKSDILSRLHWVGTNYHQILSGYMEGDLDEAQVTKRLNIVMEDLRLTKRLLRDKVDQPVPVVGTGVSE